jgi:hypothetical protein
MISKRYLFNTNKCIIKHLLNSVFAICKIIKVSVIDLDKPHPIIVNYYVFQANIQTSVSRPSSCLRFPKRAVSTTPNLPSEISD